VLFKHPTVKTWLREHLRLISTFTPTRPLIAAIRSYVREHNKDPRPFIWTATASATSRKIEVVKNR
jgi:hypothetical protein